MSRVLDTTPGLTRVSQPDGSALWRVDRAVSRAGDHRQGREAAVPSPAGPVEAHTRSPPAAAGRSCGSPTAPPRAGRPPSTAPLTRTTVDGWAQGFELPADGGRLDVTYEDPVTHTAWLWAQGVSPLVLVVLALPGRRREVDDDLPEDAAPCPPRTPGEGRRARRLRRRRGGGRPTASAADAGAASDPEETRPAAVPHGADATATGTPRASGRGRTAPGGRYDRPRQSGRRRHAAYAAGAVPGRPPVRPLRTAGRSLRPGRSGHGRPARLRRAAGYGTDGRATTRLRPPRHRTTRATADRHGHGSDLRRPAGLRPGHAHADAARHRQRAPRRERPAVNRTTLSLAARVAALAALTGVAALTGAGDPAARRPGRPPGCRCSAPAWCARQPSPPSSPTPPTPRSPRRRGRRRQAGGKAGLAAGHAEPTAGDRRAAAARPPSRCCAR